jgi:hypothetical protein
MKNWRVRLPLRCMNSSRFMSDWQGSGALAKAVERFFCVRRISLFWEVRESKQMRPEPRPVTLLQISKLRFRNDSCSRG